MELLNAETFKALLISGSYSIMNHRGKIDALNVFPVPDGDTGSNMSGTLKSAVNDIENFVDKNIGEVAKKFARGALLGARGNSGVILSQIFKGFSIALESKKEANTFDLVEAFKQAKIYAYKSVIKPVEGTLLTVIRMVAEDLVNSITPSNSIIFLFEKAVDAARRACDLTPSMLPILKEVGVTDSGGEGLWYILKGMLEALKGKPVQNQEHEINNRNLVIGFEKETYEGEFGYCTEGIIELKKPEGFNKQKFTSDLEKLGNSIVVVVDNEMLKVHVHSLKPGAAITYMQKYGELIGTKIENMTRQANQSKGQKDTQTLNLSNSNQEISIKTNNSTIGVISCNDGRGIIEEMKRLGVDIIIESGQSNNPSTRDFLNAIQQINARDIIILPNNSNIILVAQQVVQTVEDKNIIIVPTKGQVEGIIAMMNFNPENSLKENQDYMNEGIAEVNTGQVTKSIKDTKMNGINIKKGQYLALANRRVIASTDSKIKSAIEIINHFANQDTELITIWYGEGASKIDAEELANYIETSYDAEVVIKHGNQHIYDFLISLE